MIDIEAILKDCSEDRVLWVLDKFKDFKRECFSNEQEAICKQVIAICQSKLNK